MASYSASLNILNPKAMSDAILDSLAERLRVALLRSLSPVRNKLITQVPLSLRATPEYTSLLSGPLRGHLGVVDARPVLESVIENVAAGIAVSSLGAKRSAAGIEGGLRLEILKSDFSEVLSVNGSFTSEGGFEIPWLRWLTLEGDRILVADHHIFFGKGKYSRTGQAIMVPRGSWRVPPEYSGTEADNWISRGLINNLLPAAQDIVAREVSQRL